MTTKIISLNEYRKNLSTLWKQSRENDIKYIVMVHSKPVFEVNPIKEDYLDENWDTMYTSDNHKAYLKAQEELKNGETVDGKEFLLDLIKSK
ncbi:hypothetical protein A9Q91_02160 [Candidatus Gracilibacteria bacterium 28_42_T64]|nr:hypothetical protein A9Q91_02160 [Candidatus Gracilibacteria bacterium 28_42_T64]